MWLRVKYVNVVLIRLPVFRRQFTYLLTILVLIRLPVFRRQFTYLLTIHLNGSWLPFRYKQWSQA